MKQRDQRLLAYIQRRGYAAECRGDFNRAQRYYRLALDVDPTSVEAAYGLAAIDRKQGRLGIAVQGFRAIAENRDSPPYWRACALIMLGDACDAEGNLDEAYRYYESASGVDLETVEAERKNWVLAHAYCGMGHIRKRLGDVSTAGDLFRKALSFHPYHAPSLANLSVVLSEQGKTFAAIEMAHEALLIDPFQGDYWHNLGVMLEEAGKRSTALKCYRVSLSLGDTRAQSAIDRLLRQ